MPAPNPKAGSQLRKLREKHGLTLHVQEITSELARNRHQPRMRIAVTKLSGIEQGRVPGIHALYALALTYKTDMMALVRLYGIPV